MALIKEARFTLLARLAAGFAEGEFSITALSYSARTVLAGLLLIFPGVVSDFIAITLLLLPGPRVGPAAAAPAVPGCLDRGRIPPQPLGPAVRGEPMG
jgi:Protein affecting phage T7 exclusion by the F plasmid